MVVAEYDQKETHEEDEMDRGCATEEPFQPAQSFIGYAGIVLCYFRQFAHGHVKVEAKGIAKKFAQDSL